MLKTKEERIRYEFEHYANSKCQEIEMRSLYAPSDEPVSFSVSSFGMQSPSYVASLNQHIS